MTQQKRPWVLPVLAHLALLCSLPFWILILAFSPLVLAGYESTPPTSAFMMLGLFWLPPLASIALIGTLWHALYHRLAKRANIVSVAFIVVQICAILWLLKAN
ncbi:hypothetical protein [Saccharospirillum mangrovi]|uniref:hypothetical protein n=1 Tax=Saccharospirillum mangrovi TaxID=2161747 RepID=UPI000D33EF2B|nr:hypothetical protein [Saccharospirillum mangrovi]